MIGIRTYLEDWSYFIGHPIKQKQTVETEPPLDDPLNSDVIRDKLFVDIIKQKVERSINGSINMDARYFTPGVRMKLSNDGYLLNWGRHNEMKVSW